MPVGKHIEQHIKDEIILKIRDGGLKVSEAASQYGISSKYQPPIHPAHFH